MLRSLFFTFAMSLVTFSNAAQTIAQSDPIPPASTSVVVNGQPVNGKVLEVDGKHFVAVEDLAQSLQGTISYSEGQIALTLSPIPMKTANPAAQAPAVTAQPPNAQPTPKAARPAPSQPVPAAAASPEAGRIKGTLTYFVDFHTGNKPDAGSKVWLVAGKVEIPADQNFVGTSTAVGTSANPGQYVAIKFSTSDENGNFDFNEIPPGPYTLVMQSAHTKGALKEKGKFFGRGDGRTLRDSNGRVEVLRVQIKAGETADGSKDFGPNIDM